MDLSIVIPAYNEEARLPQTLAEIRPFLDSQLHSYEVIIADDGSSDHTVEIAQTHAKAWAQLRVLPGKHGGKGATVKRGCLAAHGENILVMDADHATPIDTLNWLMSHRRAGYEIIVGVRTFCGQEGASGRGRRIVGLAQQLLAHILVFQQSVADSQCGFKLFSRQAAQTIFSRSLVQGGMYDVELFFLAHKFNLSIYSQPVRWVNKDGSRINMIGCLIKDPFSLLAIRCWNWLGRDN